VHLWDVRRGRRTGKLACPAGPAALALSDDGAMLAVGCVGGEVRVWHTASGTPMPAPQSLPRQVAALSFSGDGKSLAAGDYSGVIAVSRAGP
jgi:WD40 repeat protein